MKFFPRVQCTSLALINISEQATLKLKLAVPVCIGIAVVALTIPIAAKADSFWHWIGRQGSSTAYYANLLSIRRPGDLPSDDFWQITVKSQSGDEFTLYYDCMVGHYFPEGKAPSSPVPKTGLILDMFDLACAPPSQIRRMINGLL